MHDIRQSAVEEEELGISSCSLGTITHVFTLPMLQSGSIQKWCFLKLRSQNPVSQITLLLASGDLTSFLSHSVKMVMTMACNFVVVMSL